MCTRNFPGLYGKTGMDMMSGDYQSRVLPNSDTMWDNYLELWEVPEEEREEWKKSSKVTFTLMEDGSGMSISFDGLTEPMEYKFGEEQTFDLEVFGGQKIKFK